MSQATMVGPFRTRKDAEEAAKVHGGRVVGEVRQGCSNPSCGRHEWVDVENPAANDNGYQCQGCGSGVVSFGPKGPPRPGRWVVYKC